MEHVDGERTGGFRYAYPSAWYVIPGLRSGQLTEHCIPAESVRRVTDSSDWSTKPTVEITSSLRTVLEEGLKGNSGRILNALTLPMPDTTLQSPLFLYVALACSKPT